MEVRRLDPRAMAEEELATHARLMGAADGRLDAAMADDPAAMAAAIRAAPGDVDLRSYAAATAGELIGVASCATPPASRAMVSVHVLPAARRQGVGTRLLAALAGDQDPACDLEATVDAGAGPARGFLAALGWSLAGRWVTSSLRLPAVPVPAAPPAGYSVEALVGPWPVGLADAVARLRTHLPGDDTAALIPQRCAARLRERERALDELGVTRLRTLARHARSGVVAGIHELHWSSSAPAVAHVSATAVDPAHRDRGVGAALKAAALRLVAERLPCVTELRTSNPGDERQPIHRLNRRLGFQELGADETWAVGVAALLGSERIAAVRPGGAP